MKLLLLVLGMSPHTFWCAKRLLLSCRYSLDFALKNIDVIYSFSNRISWAVIYIPMLLILAAVVTMAMAGFYTQWPAFLLFFIGCVLHVLWTFGFGFLMSTFFSTASAANRVTHVFSLALFMTYFLSGYFRNGILYTLSPGLFYLLCLVEPIAFGTLIQRVHN